VKQIVHQECIGGFFIMQTNALILILAAIITGAVVPFQAGTNAALGRTLGHPLWGTFVSLCISFVCIVPVMILAKVQTPTLVNIIQAPRWIWIGGMVGVVYITGALMLAPKLGAAGFIMAVIAGQMLASIIIDQWGLVGLPQKPVSWSRLTGLGLILLGLVVMQLETLAGKVTASS
jgi:transporter family-2 protein